MNAAAIIERVRAAGGEIALAADGIRLKTPASLREELVAEVKAQKTAIRQALKAEAGDQWDADDYCAFYDETAGRLQSEGLSKPKAEAFAFECTLIEWLNRTFRPSPPECCVACGRGKRFQDPLLPFGTERAGQAWLHSSCREGWHAGRQAQAVATLAKLGIRRPAS